jgi:hypothetical protein
MRQAEQRRYVPLIRQPNAIIAFSGVVSPSLVWALRWAPPHAEWHASHSKHLNP